MNKKRSAALLAVTTVLGLGVLSGCGGDESGTDEATFAADVNAACAKQDDALTRAVDDLPAGAKEAEFAAAVVPIGEDLVADLRGITPPQDVADDYDAFVDNQQAQVDELKADPAAALAGSALAPKADALARELGVDACLTDTGAAG